ncbi:hypothetical protein VAE122_3620002 [Vibrio aestuarianus]|nr:hypothetical protein VAE122_3620002 [Vibrio aestuarianus]
MLVLMVYALNAERQEQSYQLLIISFSMKFESYSMGQRDRLASYLEQLSLDHDLSAQFQAT